MMVSRLIQALIQLLERQGHQGFAASTSCLRKRRQPAALPT